MDKEEMQALWVWVETVLYYVKLEIRLCVPSAPWYSDRRQVHHA